jgi:glycosyltransferase involved in cell wall biosynthesis
MSEPRRLALAARIEGIAGPASFQRRLEAGLGARGIGVTYDLAGEAYDAVLVIGATRRSGLLRRARQRGIPVLQRLDGMNWIHRRRWTGLRHFLRAEANNYLLRTTRSRLADGVIYQSEFARRWWESRYGPAPAPSRVIRNGVPLDRFTPDGKARPRPDGVRVVVLEGAIGGGYEVGLTWAAALAEGIARARRSPVQLMIAGRGERPAELQPTRPDVQVAWLGEVAPEAVPELLRSGDLLFSADLHPACPNSVLESLACGLPVVAFDTGAIPELVDETCGIVVPYGADPWRVETPDLDGLGRAAVGVLDAGDRLRVGARRRAVKDFGLDRMIDDYLDALAWPQGA